MNLVGKRTPNECLRVSEPQILIGTMMNISDKTLWVVCREVRSIRTPEGLLLLDFERDTYCELAVLAGAVWLLMKWTPVGITVKEIVDLLETAAPLPRYTLETETCRLVTSLARRGFVRERPPSESVPNRRMRPLGLPVQETRHDRDIHPARR